VPDDRDPGEPSVSLVLRKPSSAAGQPDWTASDTRYRYAPAACRGARL
jgi:hypothetical protein